MEKQTSYENLFLNIKGGGNGFYNILFIEVHKKREVFFTKCKNNYCEIYTKSIKKGFP